MNTDLKNFVLPIARTVSATLFFVFSVAFLSVPYSLEQDPSDAQQLTHPVAPRHMTRAWVPAQRIRAQCRPIKRANPGGPRQPSPPAAS